MEDELAKGERPEAGLGVELGERRPEPEDELVKGAGLGAEPPSGKGG